MFFFSRFPDTVKSTSFTCTLPELTHYTVLNPKPVLADTTQDVCFHISGSHVCQKIKFMASFDPYSSSLVCADFPVSGNQLTKNIRVHGPLA
jgi:hypothetical protein